MANEDMAGVSMANEDIHAEESGSSFNDYELNRKRKNMLNLILLMMKNIAKPRLIRLITSLGRALDLKV